MEDITALQEIDDDLAWCLEHQKNYRSFAELLEQGCDLAWVMDNLVAHEGRIAELVDARAALVSAASAR